MVDEATKASFAQFAAARTAALIRVAYLLTGNQHAAEDLVQSALVKTLARWSSVRHEDPEGYLRVVMYREQVSLWRRLARYRETPLAQPVDTVVPDPAARTDLALTMREALLTLPVPQRTVLVLRYYEDLTESQVAEVLGCTVGTVRSRTSRAVSRLRRLLPTLDLRMELTP